MTEILKRIELEIQETLIGNYILGKGINRDNCHTITITSENKLKENDMTEQEIKEEIEKLKEQSVTCKYPLMRGYLIIYINILSRRLNALESEMIEGIDWFDGSSLKK